MEQSSDFIIKGKTADIEMLDFFGRTSIAYKTNIEGQTCFIKKLRPELRNDKRCRDLFYKEYNTGKRICSPYVVKYLDIRDNADGLCIIMEYVSGCTIKEKIEREPEYFKRKENIRKLLLQLCEALDTLHKENVVYLDINPGNIMISQTSNNIKLIDLGFCLSDWNDTTIGTTARFGAPEAITNRTGEIDARSDIYSIGCLLQYIEEKSGAKLPGYIRRIKKRCMQKERSKRYSGTDEITKAIKRHKHATMYKVTAIVASVAVLSAGFVACGLHTTLSNYIEWECGKVPDRFESDGIFYHITDGNARTVEVTFKGEHPDEFEYEYEGSEIVVPQTVTYKGRTFRVTAFAGQAFKNPYISKVTIPFGIESIADSAFIYCNQNGVISIPQSVKHIGVAAFFPMLYIEGLEVDAKNPYYDSRDGCNAIIETATNTLIAGCNNTVIPNGVTSIAQDAFVGAQDLKDLTLPATLREIGEAAFVHSGITKINIPEGVTELERYTFQYCENLREVSLPQSLAFIGHAALSHCGITELTIPDNVTIIDDYAFDYCEQLEKVVIGKNVESIGNFAFDGCRRLTSVVSHIPADSLFEIDNNVFGNINAKCVLYVPKGAKRTYEKRYGWSGFARIVEM